MAFLLFIAGFITCGQKTYSLLFQFLDIKASFMVKHMVKFFNKIL